MCPPPPSFGNTEISIESGNRHLGIISYPLRNTTVSAFEIDVNSDRDGSPLSLSAGFTDNRNYDMKMKIVYDNQTVTSSGNAHIEILKNRKLRIYVGKSSDIDNFKIRYR